MSIKKVIGMILENSSGNGPWGGRGGDENPWGQRPQGGGSGGGKDLPPDLEAVIRDAQDRFKNVFGGRKPPSAKGFPSLGFGAIFLILVLLWLATGFYRVEPEENAVIMTFGKWTSTRGESGLGYHIPWPVQEVRKVDVAQERRVVIGYREELATRSKAAGTSDIPFESLMLTGDENIVNINFVVPWHINDAKKYLFEIRDPESTIKKVAESAMREIIGRTEIQKALTEGRSDIEIKTKELMQAILDEYNAGIAVNSVQLQQVNPPPPVVDAFDDVQRARTDLERMKNEAETYRNDIVPKSRGEAQKKMQEAEAYKASVITKAEGEAGRFLSVYKAYTQSKDVTRERIYIETMQDILRSSRKIILGDGKAAPVLPYLPIEPGKLQQK